MSVGNHASGTCPAKAASASVIGVDLGGTNLRIATADQLGDIRAYYCYRVSELRAQTAGVIPFVRQRLLSMLESDAGIRSIAIGIPGVVRENGTHVWNTDNLPELEGVNLQASLGLPTAIPFLFDNDLNMAALGEISAGTCVGCKNLVFVGLGTGLGLGIVVNGEVYRGRQNMAGELGSVLVPSPDDVPSPDEDTTPLVKLESIVSGSGIEHMWERRTGRSCGAKEVFRRAALGNSDARAVVTRYVLYLKLALLGVALVLSPEKIVLGGGTTVSLQSYLDELQGFLKRHVPVPPEVGLTSLGSDAGIVGAVHAALEIADMKQA